MTASANDPFGVKKTMSTSEGEVSYYSLQALEEAGVGPISKLPFTIRILLESVLRNVDGEVITEEHVRNLANWNPKNPGLSEVPFVPSRVVLQDFTGVPAVVDLAALRDAMKRLGGNPERINPLVPVDLVIDHSVQVDYFGTPEALAQNAEREFERNLERYEFLRWGSKVFQNFRVVPPATGIVHQVNLEYLANVVQNYDGILLPDTVVGTDSHTPMVNGLGVVGWGVGGIEAEAAMLGQPVYMLPPAVIGVRVTGTLPEGATATDLVLTFTELTRKYGVVGKFLEIFGDGLDTMNLPTRALLGNMTPEYGATVTFSPVDDETLKYMRFSGRSEEVCQRTEQYTKANMLWRTGSEQMEYTDVIELDLSSVEPSLAGPKRPQDRVSLNNMKETFETALTKPQKERGFELSQDRLGNTGTYKKNGTEKQLRHGDVVIAAITSCTNTSNPSVMIGAGLVAKKAVEKGLSVKPWVKTSLAPGSKVVTEYLDKSGLTEYLDKMHFNTVGYGCTTCIGNSGPLPDEVIAAVEEGDLVVASVLSGNRNFEGRINPHTRANYLASPPLVVAYAIAGKVDIDFANEPISEGSDGPVYLKDIWPTNREVNDAIEEFLDPEMFRRQYGNVWNGNEQWNKIESGDDPLYAWNEKSTYIQHPPFFAEMTRDIEEAPEFKGMRALAVLGDSVTTDHISPAGAIPRTSPAATFLKEQGVEPREFNSFGSRRGNDRIMVRGTFGNIRLKNLLAPGTEGGVTRFQPSGEEMSIYDAAMKYKEEGTGLIVLAGKEYGTGSSRDWAAKGTFMLGVQTVVAESYERIHRSNLIGMGILPLQFKEGESYTSHGITGIESFSLRGLDGEIKPGMDVELVAANADGSETVVKLTLRLDSNVEINYWRNGGILHTVLRQMVEKDLA